ncbi:DUF2806 domain-containing protein [Tindallia californiensis]|uniref:DUF2806 domain-containing protein n=1 Tax=Tindallia californiensis TaxID=159292 RepID=A0A1H3QT83_9FIRM|nr:DUF2806 domain-containing protein [Tindallia californiensis]SDZ16208.1 Protein of unknown function [Tindallia californiensis]
MSDIKGIEFTDILGLSEPITKLIEVLAGGCGKVYEPTHINRIAKAKASEIRLISEAVNENLNLPTHYSGGDVTIDTTSAQELIQRAGNRFLYQEMKKQQNIESIAAVAYKELENEVQVSEEQVDSDWITRFFNSIEDISDNEMQEIWGRILAGEIKQPNTYSLRTLDKLKNINKTEAFLFEELSKLVVESSSAYFIFDNNETLNKQGLYFSQILDLEECGLISAQSLTLNLKISKDITKFILNEELVGIFSTQKEGELKITISIYTLTKAGVQLYKVVKSSTNAQYLIDNLKVYQRKSTDYNITAHRINFIDESGINYDDDTNLLADIEVTV